MAETDVPTLRDPGPEGRGSGGSVGVEIVRLARGSIEHGLVHREPLPINYGELPRALADPAATFTTLHVEGQLRGCCGTLEAERPLAADVAYSAFRAAFRDPRFEPVVEHELSSIRLEVSVLSPLESMPVTDEADLLSHLTPGVDGLVIVAEGRHASDEFRRGRRSKLMTGDPANGRRAP